MRNDYWYVLEREIEDGLPDKVIRGYNEYECYWKYTMWKRSNHTAHTYSARLEEE